MWEKRAAPNPKHAMQKTSYGFLYGIDKVLWIYASRESFGASRKIYLQDIDKSEIEGLVSSCNKIGQAVKEGRIKELPKSKDCRWCAYLTLCKELDNSGI